MKTLIAGAILAGLIASVGCDNPPREARVLTAQGPNGGDLVSIADGTAYVEIMANADTGEVVAHVLGKDVENNLPITAEPITVGSGRNRVALTPKPSNADPSGASSRFLGQADWLRGGQVHRAWIQVSGTAGHQEFELRHGWDAGRLHWQTMSGRASMRHRHEPSQQSGEMEHSGEMGH